MRQDAYQSGAETAAVTTPLLREYVFPADLEFEPGGFSPPAAPPGVGSITREQGDPLASLTEDEKRAAAESFRGAYVEGLLRGLPLEGTLGGDLVHSWPPDEPLGLAQNWRSRETASNSWGMPSLVLAIRGRESGNALIVRGGILDQYGKSGGRDRANGIAGYGAPLGEEFLYRDGIAQWFERGLIRVDAMGRGFFEPLDLPALPPDGGGHYVGEDGIIEEHFRRALRRGVYSNLPELRADDPALRLDIPANETTSGGTLYYQTFNQGSVLLLLPRIPDFPFQARIIAGAFLQAFLSAGPAGDLYRRLLQGLERYGPPLTDAYPAPGGDGEAQRFARGTMVLKPTNLLHNSDK
ncbi:MAG: hypothetical protein LBU16_06310 [Treponema sp.]|nr:hypothetical protein [Treponema sp.]